MYYTYMIRCKDDSIYTGITTDIKRRMDEHFNKNEKCSKYTFVHTATKIEKVWKTETRALASKLEYHIKTLTKVQKENLINNNCTIEDFLSEKIDSTKYIECKYRYI